MSRRTFLSGAALSALAVGASGIMSRSAAAAARPPGAAPATAGTGGAVAVPKGAVHSRAVLARTQPPGVTPDLWGYRPFGLSDVSVDDGVFQRGYSHHLAFARAYSVDRILAVFRRNAGLDTNGATPPGGWEEYGPAPDEQRWGPSEYVRGQNTRTAAGLLRGHYGGHFLTMLSMAYASSGEADLKAKVDQLVTGLKECQDALAAQTLEDGTPRYSHPGFLSAYGEWQFSALEEYAPYGEIWAPYYTLHKILDGLVNAYKFAGNATALEVAEKVGRWVHSRLSACTQSQLDRMWGMYIAGECGGMNDSLVELYWLSEARDRDVFLEAAKLFDLNTLIDSCATGTDTLNGKHANQHVPTFVGYAKLYAATGEDRYLRCVENFFDMIVPGRMYPHGGTGEGEMWGPPNTVAGDIGGRNAESCAAYNMVKVAWQLFLITGKPKYTEYCERTVLNHILGGRRNRESLTGPENLYMFPVNAGTVKEYGNGNIGTCCGGTGLESPTRYQETAYAASKDGTSLLVNLYMGSTLTWDDRGVKLVQVTDYPREDTTTLTFERAPSDPLTLELRIPAWATEGVSLSVNGTAQDVPVPAGGYARVTRTWSAGDRVELVLPMHARVERPIDSTTLQSLHYGPTVFSIMTSDSRYQKLSLYSMYGLGGHFDDAIRWDGERFTLLGHTWDPLYAGNDISYSVYFQREEKTVAFAGRDSGVANPAKQGGSTLLDEIWEGAPFANRDAFLARVTSVTGAFVDEGLLTARNRQRILMAAAQARMTGGPR